jgi:2-oxoglutarate dehydrogenase E1 component
MSASKNLEYEKTSFLNKSNSAFIERMYLKFVNKEADLPDSWKDYFEGIGDELNIIAKEINGPSWGPKKNTVDIDELQKKIDQEEQNSNGIAANNNGISSSSSKSNEDSIKAVSMIRSYRQRGHLIAKLDPLELMKSDYLDELHPESFGFKKKDYQKNIYLGGVTNRHNSNIKELLAFLKKTYCGPVGYEYMHISNPTERKWFRDRIEKSDDNLNFTKNGKEAILNKLIQAEGFEKFLHTKYVGTKRFGLRWGRKFNTCFRTNNKN